jgi:hypothetical protein
MKKYLLLLALVFLCAIGIATATQQQFMFGVWDGVPDQAAMFYDTLHMNTILGDCFNDYQLEQYSNPLHPLKVIVKNQWYSSAGMNAYLRLYTNAPYAFFESEGTEFAASHLRYIGGQDENIGGVNCHYFQTLANPPDSLMLIQTGPGTQGSKLYNQLGWYWPQFVDTTYEPAHLQYKAFLRFKLGPRTGPVSSEPFAVFYVGHYGGLDEVELGVNDTLIDQTPVYLYDSQFDSAGTDFIWSNVLEYQWRNSINDPSHSTDQAVYDVMFNVRWSGTRDIYIDKVKIMDNYGHWLWEDTVTSYRDINNFVTRFYDTSSTILGWYLQDDQDVATSCNNVYSARRVDSLLTHRFSKKPGFVVPGAVMDYLSIASYSNASFWAFPIGHEIRTDSDGPYEGSLQQAWDGHTDVLARMSALARSKGVPLYTTLQAHAYHNIWRVPTPQENLCQVNLTLAYGTNGILYWRYGAYDGWEDSTGRTPFWYGVKETVGPYIEKMGPIFASLEWKGAWKWGFEDKPTGTPIREILCNEYSSDPIYCPDCLYMQVAEFEPASHSNDTAYFFLVNRRCLTEESITGTVSFDEFGGIGRELKVFHVTDMLTGASWLCDDNHSFYSFNYTVPPGAGRLYRVTPRCRHHGDANGDGSIDVSDATYIIAYIFSGGPAPVPYLAGDANCDDEIDISDATFLISYIFSGGPAPCPGCVG